jgi:hypothetical protein
MSIRRIQVNRAIEKIVKHYLFHGRYPTFQTITHHFSQWLREHTPGAPTFKPLIAFRKGNSNSKHYNQNVDMIHTDLSDAYQATIEQTTRVMKDFEYTETERSKMWHQMGELSKKIDELLMVSGNADFKHFNGRIIDFENMDLVNTSQSSIWVDLKNRQVTLKENLPQTKKIKIDGTSCTFKPLMPIAKTEALETISNAFDDNLNTAWWQVVKSETPGSIETESSMGMRAELTIMFNGLQEFNEISYLAHHGKPLYTKIEYTLDGVSFTPLPDKNNHRIVKNYETWQFSTTQAIGIKFIFEKKEHDDRSAGVYQYYFGAKDISISNKSYLSEGVFYSQPITFESNIQQLTLETLDDVPYNTDLSYEVAIYDENKSLNSLHWFPISSINNSQPKAAKVIEFKSKNIRTIETDKAEYTREVKNGMQVFRLMKDNGDGIVSELAEGDSEVETFEDITTSKLFRGINQWRRERCYIPFDGTVPVNSRWGNQIIERPNSITTDYFPIGNFLSLQKSSGNRLDNYYRFTTCIYSDDPQSYPLSLAVVQTLASGSRKRLGSYSVYVNQERQVPTNDEVTLNFKKGWNEIQILYHWGDLQRRADFNEAELPLETYLGKFNFARQQRVRADFNPLNYIDVHSLYHNVSPNNHQYFSIHERQVVLNYLPKNCIFQFVYEAVIENGKNLNQVVVRANLNRNPESVDITPKIKSIRLRAK